MGDSGEDEESIFEILFQLVPQDSRNDVKQLLKSALTFPGILLELLEGNVEACLTKEIPEMKPLDVFAIKAAVRSYHKRKSEGPPLKEEGPPLIRQQVKNHVQTFVESA